MPAQRKLKILIEGDSWHDLPKLGFKLPGYGGSDYDVARALDDLGHQVRSYARWGHTTDKIVADKEYLQGLSAEKPDVLILCGGGNDMFDGQRLKKILRIYKPDRKPLEYIKKSEFTTVLNPILDNYRVMFSEIRAHSNGADVPIICHSYDYILPRPSYPWFFAPMQFQGIFDEAGTPRKKGLAEAIARELVHWFHNELKKVTKEFDEIYLVKLHGTVGSKKKDWHDEIHPRKPGFNRIARKLERQALMVTEVPSDVHIV